MQDKRLGSSCGSRSTLPRQPLRSNTGMARAITVTDKEGIPLNTRGCHFLIDGYLHKNMLVLEQIAKLKLVFVRDPTALPWPPTLPF